MRRLLVPLLVALLGLPVLAQDGSRIEARVTFIAGQNLYLEAGRDAGLAANDTLRAFRADQLLGMLAVISTTDERAVVTFVGDLFPVTLGDVLALERAVRPPDPEPSVTPAQPTPPVERPSLLDAPTTPTRPTIRAPRLSGRLQVGVDGLVSSTQATDTSPQVDRTFTQPFATLRAAVDDLPGGLHLDAHLRAAYRSADPFPLDRPTDVRVYSLGIEKAFTTLPLTVTAGRFYNRYDRFSGYWDGLNLHVGDREQGVGVAAGFQPSRTDASPSGDLPKYTVFGHRAFAVEGARVDAVLLAGQVRPRNDSMQTRTFIGAQQTAHARGFALSTEALLDQDPETGEWTFSRLNARINTTISDGLRLRAYARSSRSYLFFGEQQTLLDRTTRFGGGATLLLRSGPLPNTALRADLSTATAEGRPSTLTASGGLSIPRIPSTGVGLSANATVWTRDEVTGTQRGLYGSAGLTRSFGSLYARLGYRYQQSPLTVGEALVTHGLEALVQVPITRRLAFTMQASTNLSDRISSTRIYSALWYRL